MIIVVVRSTPVCPPDRRRLMKTITKLTATLLVLGFTTSVAAQQPANCCEKTPAPAASSDSAKKEATKSVSLFRPIEIDHLRPSDQRGVNVFESPKETQVRFDGFKLAFGGAFTQEFQGLDHSNTAAPVMVNGVNTNQLMTIGHGFNNA